MLTTRAVAAELRLANTTSVIQLIDSGALRAINVGTGKHRKFRIRREWLDAFIAEREVRPPAPAVRRPKKPPTKGVYEFIK